ncbi:hypothetical protein MNB_SV-15-1150 [hydrothermal vent metagenome]|uniref:DUF4214 domain-containing protein n=1 Tax=hydrothermal vent metagenome TaxID=652676 RepID=A0A1W1EL14_9ZZZZ
MNKLNNGNSKAYVLDGFLSSQEFLNLCSNYGIKANFNDVINFVTRFYQKVLNRNPDTTGLNNWVKYLTNGTKSGADIAKGFIFSEEFKNRDIDNKTYIDILYKSFFDREGDIGGITNWMNKLNRGTSKAEILNGFLNSQEFINLCKKYKIKPASSLATEALIDIKRDGTNIILVHGLNSGASTWEKIAPRLSKQMGVEDGSYVEIAIDIKIDDSELCWDGAWLDEKLYCNKLTDIDSLDKFRDRNLRSYQKEYVYGLKKGQFEITSIKWASNGKKGEDATSNNKTKQDRFYNQKVFTINFSHNNQLSFDAQGYQLKKVIDEISKITGIDDYILIGHSMGGLASRAYIQNEETKNIIKFITLDTPHLGGIGASKYTSATKNAGINLASDSLDISQLNDSYNIGNKYEDIKVYHLGYSDGLNSFDTGNYYSQGDGNVYIGSQMGLDELKPFRIIFSPTLKDGVFKYDKEVTKLDKTFSTNLDKADKIIQIPNYSENISGELINAAHTEVLKDNRYIKTIQSIISDDITALKYATVQIYNKTDFYVSRDGIYQLYIKDSNSYTWGSDFIGGKDFSIESYSTQSFKTFLCDRYIDIQAKGLGGSPIWTDYNIYLPCNENKNITVLFE